uniref:Protein RER1 n=1 Tax=Phascolarctos cinereus TaxID=38626 RepID=A0A6P5JAX6_PHACI|nr:protein RER1 isoform X2 [Phascolarctos cinereus]
MSVTTSECAHAEPRVSAVVGRPAGGGNVHTGCAHAVCNVSVDVGQQGPVYRAVYVCTLCGDLESCTYVHACSVYVCACSLWRHTCTGCLQRTALSTVPCTDNRMSEGDSVGDSVHGKPSVVFRFFTRLGQIYQSWLDKSTPYTAVRWVVTLGLSFIYMIRVYLLQCIGIAYYYTVI